MDRAYRNLLLPGGLIMLGAWLAFDNASTGDYPMDAAPAVAALDHGRIGSYLSAHPAMGPLATILEAPFALVGSNPVEKYQWVCLVGILTVALLGRLLFGIARQSGATNLAATVIAVLCVVNPITVGALRTGHPEELLTAALAVAAVVVAGRGHSLRAGLLLGMAIASKQWAVMAILPVLMALPRDRAKAAGLAVAIVVAFMLPAFIASPDSLLHVQREAASGGGIASIWSGWYAFAPIKTVQLAGIHSSTQIHAIPSMLQPLTHPLLVALFFALPLSVWAWRARFRLDAERAIALLALLALLRCALDPVDNLYYHAPLLLALLAWDSVSPLGKVPIRALAGTIVLFLLWRWSQNLGNLDAFALVYVCLAGAGSIAIAMPLFGHRAGGAMSAESARFAEPG